MAHKSSAYVVINIYLAIHKFTCNYFLRYNPSKSKDPDTFFGVLAIKRSALMLSVVELTIKVKQIE